MMNELVCQQTDYPTKHAAFLPIHILLAQLTFFYSAKNARLFLTHHLMICDDYLHGQLKFSHIFSATLGLKSVR